MGSRTRDVEAELNLPPGFRFHPTDEELVVHYLCRKVACQCLPAPVIAEVDLYKYHPWELPDKAMFGQTEWYFFTQRDRKYPNGSRPNRTAGGGYWKATGADKPVSPDVTRPPLGIKKALVFYAGKAPKGVKTDWIMHEYRLPEGGRGGANKKGTLKLDDCVLCRLYNKKNRWEKVQQQRMEACFGSQNMDTGSESFGAPESNSENDVFRGFEDLGKPGAYSTQASRGLHTERTSNSSNLQTVVEQRQKEDREWFAELNLDELQSSFLSFGSTSTHLMSNQDHFSPGRGNLPPF